MSKIESAEKYVNERDRFIFLVEQSQKDVNELIEISTVLGDLKVKCAKWFEDSLGEFKRDVGQSDVESLARKAVVPPSFNFRL